mgnify:FL=1
MTIMKKIKKNGNMHTVIDIGNSKVCCLIGTTDKNKQLQPKVVGFGQHVSQGIMCGKITNMKEIANSIARAVEGAEAMAGFAINKVTCNISGGRPITKVFRNEITIQNRQILKSDIIKVQKENIPKKINNYKLLSSRLIKFYIDNFMPVDNPIGLHARKLILDMTYTYAEDSVLKNITNAINSCHLKIENFIITPEASGIACTIQEEKKNGAIVIDLGGNLTSIGIFKSNNIIFSDTIPIGGVHITSDIVRGLGCKAEDAEKLKILHGSVMSNEIDEYHNIEAPIISDDGKIRSQIIPKAMLTAMIKPRIEEIFDLIKNRLSVLYITKDIETIILCGGGANLNDIKHFTNLYFKKNARIGYPVNIINDLPEIVENPTFSCLVGLLIKSLKEENLTIALNDNSNFFNNFGRLGQWFDQNL